MTEAITSSMTRLSRNSRPRAKTFAEAGADCVAPSDMMDGRVAAIRDALATSGNDQVLIMSYAAKFHSNFYGPFRVAADSAPTGDAQLKDRASYQIDPGRPRDAVLSAERDAAEGADVSHGQTRTPIPRCTRGIVRAHR